MFKLEIKTGNAAFCNPLTGEEDEESEDLELSRILSEMATKVRNGQRCGSVFDINGNKVGKWSV